MKDAKIFLKKKKKIGKKKAQDRYQNLSKQQKEKKRHYHLDRNKSLSEEEKEKKLLFST